MTQERVIDPHSATWKVVSEWAETRIRQHQNQLEMPALPADQTEFARGSIRELRLLLKQIDKKPVVI